MDLYNFNIRIRESGSGLLGQTAQHRNAQAHVSGIKYGDFHCGSTNDGLFFFRVAGGADHGGAAVRLCKGDHIPGCAVVGKIDDHIRIHRAQLLRAAGNAITAVGADPAHHFIAQNPVDQLAHGAVGAPKNRFHTSIPSFLISS